MKRFMVFIVMVFIAGCKINRGPEMRVCNHVDLDSITCLFPRNVDEVSIMKQQAMHDIEDMINYLQSFDSPFKMNFYNSLRVYDNAYFKFLTKSNVLSVMALLHSDPTLKAAANQASLDLEQFQERHLKSSAPLLQFFKDFRSCVHDATSQRSDVRRFVGHKIDDLKHRGADFVGNDLTMSKLISQQILELEGRYRGNVQRYQGHIICGKDELDGVSADFVSTLFKQHGNYVVPCDYNSFFEILENCTIAATRQKFFQKFGMRAYPENIAILRDLIGKRNQFAHIAGYDDFVSYQLASTMAEKPDKVEDVLWKVLDLIQPKVDAYFKAATKKLPASVQLTPSGKLQPWDESFVYSMYRKKMIGLTDDQIAQYFPLKDVLKGLKQLLEEFFQITIDTVDGGDVWAQGVVCWKVRMMKNHSVLGYIFLDLHQRDHKFDGACHMPLVPAMTDDCNIGCRSATVAVTNFAIKNGKTLLTIYDIKTLLHELGHAFHDIFGSTRFAEMSGINVAQDFLEAPSQSLELLAMVPEVLQKMSRHVDTSAKMSLDIAHAIVKAEKLGKPSMLERQCLLSLIALELGKELEGQNIEQIVENLYKKVRTHVEYDSSYHFEAAFPHLSDYGACYYGYVWSEILAASMFQKMMSKHGRLHRVGHLFYEKVLKHGGLKDPHQLVENFVGKKVGYKDLLHIMA